MGKKRNYDSAAESMGLDVRDESIPIRSRRQRTVKARVRDDDDDARHSSQDSGCGEHYSPTNIAEAERVAEGCFMTEGLPEERAVSPLNGRRAPAARRAGVRAPAKPRRRPAGDGASKKVKGGMFKKAAETVLEQKLELMKTKEIFEEAKKHNLIDLSSGKTPESTMASALYTDMKRRGNNSLFIRPSEGWFGLRVWLHPNCNILSQEQRDMVIKADQGIRANLDQDEPMLESDLDSGIQISDFGAQDAQAVATPTKTARKTTARNNGNSRAPKTGSAKGGVRKRKAAKSSRPRSASVPPTPHHRRGATQHTAQQPALSGPPGYGPEYKMKILCDAALEVSGTSATSSRSGAPSQTDSEGAHNYRPQSSADEINPRASAEPENSVHAPTAEGHDDKPEVAQLFKAEPAEAPQVPIIDNQAQPAAAPVHKPVATVYNPMAGLPSPPAGTLEAIQPLANLNMVANLAEIADCEAKLRDVDSNNHIDLAQVYMRLYTAYASANETEKAREAHERLASCLDSSLANLDPDSPPAAPVTQTPKGAEGTHRWVSPPEAL